jgi:4-amino-4-deoxy-L-arabinose transferase-like glycosyltransferase
MESLIVARKQFWTASVLVCLIAITLLTAGVAYSYYLGDRLRFLPDEKDYTDIAINVASGRGYSLNGATSTAFRPPGYPLLLAPFIGLGAQIAHLRILNFALLTLSVILVYRIVESVLSRWAGLIGAILTVVYAVLFYTAGTLYPQTLGATLLLLTLYLLFVCRRTWLSALAAGVTLGWLVLTIPNFIVSAPLIAIGVWVIESNQANTSSAQAASTRRARATHVTLFLAVAIAIVGVWTLRNAATFGRLVFVSSNSGVNLLVGNSENASPIAGRTTDISTYTAQARSMDEIDEDNFYRSRAFEWIQSNPMRAAGLFFAKFIHHFNFRNELETRSEASPLRDAAMFVTYYPLLLCAALGLIFSRWLGFTRLEWLCVALYASGALVSAVFFPRIRFRLPYDYLLIVLAAGFIYRAAMHLQSGVRAQAKPA